MNRCIAKKDPPAPRRKDTSRALLDSILSHAPDHILALDRRGRITFINRTRPGTARGDVVGKTLFEVTEPDDRPVIRRAFDAVLRHGTTQTVEAKGRAPDGSLTWWRSKMSPVRLGGRIVSVVMIARDVTDDRRRAEELERAQARFRGIFEHSRDAMDLVSRDGALVEVNPAMCRLVGYSREELLGLNFARITPPEWRGADEEAWRQILKDGEAAYEFEKEYVRKDGSRVPVSLTVFLVPGTGGAAIIRDMTERRRLEREILQTGAREQSQLARELHDSLGQELTGLSLQAQSLARALEDSAPEQARAARRIATVARSSVESVRKLAAGLMPAELLPDGLPAALGALRAQAQRLFGLRVDLSCPEDLERLEDVSIIHLYRIAQEAVTNAAKHSRARRVRIALSRRRSLLELSVADDGVGLRRRRPGGLGLKIMRQRCLTLGGTFSVRPGRRGGTEVLVRIPLAN